MTMIKIKHEKGMTDKNWFDRQLNIGASCLHHLTLSHRLPILIIKWCKKKINTKQMLKMGCSVECKKK